MSSHGGFKLEKNDSIDVSVIHDKGGGLNVKSGFKGKKVKNKYNKTEKDNMSLNCAHAQQAVQDDNVGDGKMHYVLLNDTAGYFRFKNLVKHFHEKEFIKKMRKLTSSTPDFVKSDIKRSLSEVKDSVKNGKFESTNKVK